MRIVIGAVVVAAVYWANLGYVEYQTYQRERRIADTISEFKGLVGCQWVGPDWIPRSIRNSVPFFYRIMVVGLNDRKVSSDLIVQAGSLTSLKSLDLSNTQMTDAGLQHLKGMASLTSITLDATQVSDAGTVHLKSLTKLNGLCLSRTHVTDSGLEYLGGLTNLISVSLVNTQTTPEGRAMLRKTLPNCKIAPNP